MRSARTRGVRRAFAGAAAFFVAGLIVTPAAFAAPAGRIVEVRAEGSTLNLVFSAAGLADGQSIDPASVKVQVAGVPVPAKAVPVAGVQAPGQQRIALLTMDTSGSMAGAPLASAKNAAKTFVGSVPADVRVGLVTFGDAATVKVNPTLDRAAVLGAVNGLEANGSTALYDATTLSVATAGPAGARSILLLTDGKDEGSKTKLGDATSAVKSSGVILDAVSIGSDVTQTAPLQQLATAGRGRLLATDNVAVLTEAFKASARTITNQVSIAADVPVDLSGKSGTVTVSAQAGGATISDSVFATVGTSAAAPAQVTDYGPKQVTPSNLAQRLSAPWVIALGGLLLFVGLAALLSIAFSAANRAAEAPTRMNRRMSIYTLAGRGPVKEAESTALGSSGVARSAVDLANRVVVKRDFESVIALRLDRAAVPLKPAEWTLIHLGITLGSALLLLFLFGGKLIPALIGLAIGFTVPWLYLSRKESRRQSAFLAGLPDTLQLVAGSLKSGYSLPQSIDLVVNESQPPISAEFNRALVETRLGVPLEDALDGIADRMKSVDFAWVVMAIRIQREVGGNLAEILTTVAATLRERERLRRQVEVLSAEGRLSAWVLGLLPVLFTLYLLLVRPEYLESLWKTLLGWVLIGVGVVLMIVGILWLRKAVKVEV